MAIQYMDDGFGPHVDRGFATAKTRLEPSRLSFHQDDETESHARAMVEHVLALEAERVPAVTAELFAEGGCRGERRSTSPGKRPRYVLPGP